MDNSTIEKDIRVYKMNDYEWYASKWSIEDTNEWYKKEFVLDDDENPIDEIRVCNLDEEGVWMETTNEEDLKEIGDNDEIGNVVLGKPNFGDLKRENSSIWKYISFREAIQSDLDFEEPYCIATTEY